MYCQILFTKLPSKGRFALRDRTLLLFLYNTGARVQEVAELRFSNLKPQPRVHLHGKGNKWRVCPLFSKTKSKSAAICD
jgi:integrase/recombinase XerD